MSLLEVTNLKTRFDIHGGSFFAVDDISFTLQKGETLGLVGESGCGKSVTALSILRLIQTPPGIIAQGSIKFNGIDLLKLDPKEIRKVRGKEISMIFQEPMTSLNPVFTCGEQIREAIAVHNPELASKVLRDRVIELLTLVGIPEPERRFDDYPHELSGGMRQRVVIAMALSCNPKLLIADEPTTALDVTIQAQILDLMRGLQKKFGAGMILITHDLGIVAETCHHVAVMYAGKIVEYATIEDIFYRPKHPYTVGLLRSIPHFDSKKRFTRLPTIKGVVPNPLALPKGCRFQDRCDRVNLRCRELEPQLTDIDTNHRVACYFPVEDGALNG